MSPRVPSHRCLLLCGHCFLLAGRRVCFRGESRITQGGIHAQALTFYFTYPRDREAIGRHGATPAYLLQQFAWTEADVPRKHAARATATAGNAALHTRVASAPLFCFETAIKLFFWAVMSYSYKEADPADIRAMPDAIRSLVVDMESAMRLYRLAKRCMFYDRELGTKVLVTWNAELILVAVRGSAEAANFLEDAKVRRRIRPSCVPGRLAPCGEQGLT